MRFQVTVRYGSARQRYHTYAVEAVDAKAALVVAADHVPPEIQDAVDLVELRVAPDPDGRSYVGDE